MDLVGRRLERQEVERALTDARTGRSRALVVTGEAGIGKTALLDHARAIAVRSDFRIAETAGIEAETQFAFAALHRLCLPLSDHLSALPEPQRSALSVAFGERPGTTPDRFLVGLAVLTLLAESAEDKPLACLVEDTHWLDDASAQVLAFVARRVSAERIALLFSTRDGEGDSSIDTFAGLHEVRLTGLSDGDARALLATSAPTLLDGAVRDRIIAEARGNPLALLELRRGDNPSGFAGTFERLDSQSVPRRIEDGFRQRSKGLPAETQLLLLLAAAEPTGDADLLRRASQELTIDTAAAGPAESAGLLEIDSRVRFRHPLVRSAVYQAAAEPDRRRVHAALAKVTDPQTDPDRRAWHRAQAVIGTDDKVATELEQSADRARSRGGLAAAAVFLEQSAALTPDPKHRARRALEAAHVMHEMGASSTALQMLSTAETGPLEPLGGARLELLRAVIAFHLTRDSSVPAMLVSAARRLAPMDAGLSRETFLDAIDVAFVMGSADLDRVAAAAQEAPSGPTPPRPQDVLLDGLVATVGSGYEAGIPALRLGLRAILDDTALRGSDLGMKWLWLAGRNAVGLLDDELLTGLTTRHVALARHAGAFATLPAALSFQASVLSLTGDLARAAEVAAEATSIGDAIGHAHLRHGQLMLAGWRGDRVDATELARVTLKDPGNPTGSGEAAVAHYAMAVLHNGLGDYARAWAASVEAQNTAEPGLASVGPAELIEAAVRLGDTDAAQDALERFSTRAEACATPWALGLLARCRALVSTDDDADTYYLEAIDQLSRSRMRAEAARAHLLYGEWLRRQGRRHEARTHLRTAHEGLDAIGADAFASRAARELRATGEHPRKRSDQPADALTPHELQIARLVATGATSREVASQLFLSPRTIEAHLRSIFSKLGITSRRQLRDLPLG